MVTLQFVWQSMAVVCRFHYVSIHTFSEKTVLVVSFFFSPPTDWKLTSQFKMALIIPRCFEKLFLSLNFSCFKAHSFPMAVLVRTVRCDTVGRRRQYRKYSTGLAGYFARCHSFLSKGKSKIVPTKKIRGTLSLHSVLESGKNC